MRKDYRQDASSNDQGRSMAEHGGENQGIKGEMRENMNGFSHLSPFTPVSCICPVLLSRGFYLGLHCLFTCLGGARGMMPECMG